MMVVVLGVLVMVMVMVVARGRIRDLGRGMTRTQCGMYLPTATSLDEVDRVGNNTVREKHLHILSHSLDTPGERHDEGVVDRSRDRSGQRRKRRVLHRRREQEMYDPRRMPLDQG